MSQSSTIVSNSEASLTLEGSSYSGSDTLAGSASYSSSSTPFKRIPLPAVKGTIRAIDSPRSRSTFEYEDDSDLASTLRSQSVRLSPTPSPTTSRHPQNQSPNSNHLGSSTPITKALGSMNRSDPVSAKVQPRVTGCGVVFTPDPTVRTTLVKLPTGSTEVAQLFGV